MPARGDANPAASTETPDARRLHNAERVLARAWSGEVLTASSLMADLPGTRATTLAVCDDLVERGWLKELGASHTGQGGRPSRRFRLRADAITAIGVDAGTHTINVTVIDAVGDVIHTAATPSSPETDGPTRRTSLRKLLNNVVAKVSPSEERLVAVCIGVPAPVDADGQSPSDELDFWSRMNPGLQDLLDGQYLIGSVENDANLAAVAEGVAGAAVGVSSYATLLTGDGLGAGVVVDGHQLRGYHGMAGELGVLDFVDGGGSHRGFGALAADLAALATTSGRPPRAASGASTAGVLAATAARNAAASTKLDALADRLARISAVLAGATGVRLIVLAGAAGGSSELLLARTRPRLAKLAIGAPPVLAASALGARAVTVGAAHRALQLVKERAPMLKLRR